MNRDTWTSKSVALALGVTVLICLCVAVWRGQGTRLTYNGKSFERHFELAGPEAIEKGALELGPEKTIPILIDALERDDGFIKKVQLKLWSKLPASFRQKRQHWTPMPAFSTHVKVAAALMHIGPEASNAVPALVRRVKQTPYPGLYIFALSETGRDSIEARQTLIALSRSTNQQVASMVAQELGRFTSGAKEVVPNLISNLESQTSVPYNELLAIRMLGTNAASAAPALLRWVNDPRTKGNAAAALTRLGPAAVAALPVITDRADAGELWAIETLMNIGPAASNALPVLTNVLRPSRGFTAVTRLLAVAAIGRITGDQVSAAESIATHLRRRHLPMPSHATWSAPWNDMRNLSIVFGQQETACWLLGEIGPTARGAVADLTNVLATPNESDPIFNDWAPIIAARALWMIESNSILTVPRLSMALTNRNDIDAQLAARVLGQIGPAASAAIPDLERACKRSWRIRREAVLALQRIRNSSGGTPVTGL